MDKRLSQSECLLMLQAIVTYECPACGNRDLVKNGHDYKWSQKYYCKRCKRYGTLQARRGYDQRTRSQVKRAVLERVSLRRTVAHWLVEWSTRLPPLADTLSEAH